MEYSDFISQIVECFHKKYGYRRDVIRVWASFSPFANIYYENPKRFYGTSCEVWADKLYSWCKEDGDI